MCIDKAVVILPVFGEVEDYLPGTQTTSAHVPHHKTLDNIFSPTPIVCFKTRQVQGKSS